MSTSTPPNQPALGTTPATTSVDAHSFKSISTSSSSLLQTPAIISPSSLQGHMSVLPSSSGLSGSSFFQGGPANMMGGATNMTSGLLLGLHHSSHLYIGSSSLPGSLSTSLTPSLLTKNPSNPLSTTLLQPNANPRGTLLPSTMPPTPMQQQRQPQQQHPSHTVFSSLTVGGKTKPGLSPHAPTTPSTDTTITTTVTTSTATNPTIAQTSSSAIVPQGAENNSNNGLSGSSSSLLALARPVLPAFAPPPQSQLTALLPTRPLTLQATTLPPPHPSRSGNFSAPRAKPRLLQHMAGDNALVVDQCAAQALSALEPPHLDPTTSLIGPHARPHHNQSGQYEVGQHLNSSVNPHGHNTGAIKRSVPTGGHSDLDQYRPGQRPLHSFHHNHNHNHHPSYTSHHPQHQQVTPLQQQQQQHQPQLQSLPQQAQPPQQSLPQPPHPSSLLPALPASQHPDSKNSVLHVANTTNYPLVQPYSFEDKTMRIGEFHQARQESLLHADAEDKSSQRKQLVENRPRKGGRFIKKTDAEKLKAKEESKRLKALSNQQRSAAQEPPTQRQDSASGSPSAQRSVGTE